MNIEDLTRILPVPESINESQIPESIWKEVEQKIGCYPKGIRDFLSCYGTGSIDYFLWIFNPSAKNTNLNLFDQFNKQKNLLNGSNLDIYSSELSLLLSASNYVPFGITDNGDLLLFNVNTSNNILLMSSRGDQFETFQMNLIEFLCVLLSGGLNSSIFPEDFPTQDAQFQVA